MARPIRGNIVDPPKSSSNGEMPKSRDEKRLDIATGLISYASIPLALGAAAHERQHPGEVSPFAMDVYAIEMHKGSVGEAIVAVANEYPVLGAVLDKMAIGGPIMGLVVAGLALGAQLAENHNVCPEPLKLFTGATNRQDLAQQIVNDAERIRDHEANTDSAA